MAFPAVGAAAGRVAVPGGAVVCATLSAFETELAKYVGGGANDGDSVDIHLSGSSYAEIGIENYNCTDAGTGLRIYGDADGSTQIGYTGSGMSEAHSAVIRVGSASGNRDTNTNISFFNLEVDGNSTSASTGATWAMIMGGAHAGDEWRGNCFDIHLQGLEIHHPKNSGCKFDGNGGSDGFRIQQCTIRDFGQQYEGQEDVQGIGEGVYLGDGNTGRGYQNAVVDRCHIYNGLFGEGINTKRNDTSVADNGVELLNNLIHDVVIDNGGVIACEGYVTITGNRIYDWNRNSDSDTNYPNAISLEAGGLLENNIVWGGESANSACLRTDPENTATVTCRHNTFSSSGARTVYSMNEFGSNVQTLIATNNAYEGSLTSGTNGSGGSINDDTATFVGPTTGTADAGDGPGSGFLVTGGNARNAVSTLTVTTDIEGNTRTTPTDSGAYDGDGGTPPTVFEITFPVDSSTGVDVDAITTTGTCPALTTDVQVRITDDDQTEVYNGTTYVADVDPDGNWLDAAVVGETFSYGPFDQPPSTNMSIDIRRM